MDGDALLSPSRADSVPARAAAGAGVGDQALILQFAEHDADGVVTDAGHGSADVDDGERGRGVQQNEVAYPVLLCTAASPASTRVPKRV